MSEDEMKFLSEVAHRAKNPDMLRSIIFSAIGGVQRNAEEVRKHAVDMEVVASMALNTRLFKGNEKFIEVLSRISNKDQNSYIFHCKGP